MRILAIRGQNLASLAQSFEVDLVRGPLAGTGLFAIVGPVGAGKSTLLDALCLALFDRTPRLTGRGGVPVGDSGVDADDWLRTNDPRTLLRRDAAAGFAEADFTGRDGVAYRARWSVRRARHKLDGRVQEQELQLTDLARGVVVASGRRTDVLAAVEQRLGLDFSQFCRSVLLAQGEFAAFLRASADERAKLLETLTGADVYRRLSKRAHERARAGEREVAVLQGQLDAQAPLGDEARQALAAAVAQWQEERAACRIAIAVATRYVAWHDVAERHRRGESEATVALNVAIAADQAATGRRSALDRHRRALAVLPRHELATAAVAAAAKAAVLVVTAAGELATATARTTKVRAQFVAAFRRDFGQEPGEPVPAVVRELAQWQPLLAQWCAAVDAGDAAAVRVPGLEQQLAATAAALQSLHGEGERVAALVQRATAELDAAHGAAAAIDGEALAAARVAWAGAQRDLEACQLRLQAWAAAATAAESTGARLAEAKVAVDRAAGARAAANARLATATAAVTAARSLVESTRQRAGLIALRGQLVAGAPCPLCGATDHPAAGHRGDDAELRAAQAALAEGEREQAAAREAATTAEAAVLVAQRECQRATEQEAAAAAALATARKVSAPAVDIAAARSELARRAAALELARERLDADEGKERAASKALQAAAAAGAAANAQGRAHGARVAAAEQQQRSAAAALAEAKAAVAANARRRDDSRQALAASCAGLQDGFAALERLGGNCIAKLRALHEAHAAVTAAALAEATFAAACTAAREAAQRSAVAAAQAQQDLAVALHAAAVEATDVVAAARLGAPALGAEELSLRDLEVAVARARAILQERAEQRRLHESREAPSLDAAEAQHALDDARRSADVVEQKLVDAGSQLGMDDLIRKQRAELAPRLAEARAAFATWAALDELIGSSTGDAFAVFAQELTLDLLLLEANRRLAELARRYQLRKNPGGALDFVVVDLDLGGTARSLMTLSGGETFLVSLALALALATLAAPRSRVETLFLDEGFGTLDAASLEVALGALDSLQATGCQVGVISHVDGLGERIGAQVVVQPEGGGRSRVSASAR